MLVHLHVERPVYLYGSPVLNGMVVFVEERALILASEVVWHHSVPGQDCQEGVLGSSGSVHGLRGERGPVGGCESRLGLLSGGGQLLVGLIPGDAEPLVANVVHGPVHPLLAHVLVHCRDYALVPVSNVLWQLHEVRIRVLHDSVGVLVTLLLLLVPVSEPSLQIYVYI